MTVLKTQKPGAEPIKSFIVPRSLHNEVREASNAVECNLGQTHAALLRYALDQLEKGNITIESPVIIINTKAA